ncbi:VPLPA-CTERM sorting domain-containing protein [Roseibium sp.]|uniref:VPLPA-CTERM sorting domain-containing protein n=1 Tax=Roseibium sp. TaxID=1936156 RepID=UPI003B507366
MSALPRVILTAVCVCQFPAFVHAATITASDVYAFRVASGPNTAGFGDSDVLTFGVNVAPNGFGEDNGVPVLDTSGSQAPPTTGTATQNGVTRPLNFEGDPVNQNLYSGGVLYDKNFTGAWTLNLQNGPDNLTVATPEVGDVRLPARVNNVGLSVSGDKTTPTISWNNVDVDPDAVRLTIFDLEQRDLSGQAVEVFSSPRFRNGETSYTIPNGKLEEDRLYAIQIETRIERQSGTSSTGQDLTGSTLSVNRTWFNFATSDLPENVVVQLPEVITTAQGTPVFVFDKEVSAGKVEFYDPIVTEGYDYAIGESNPNFASFILPDLGDGLYDLYLFDESLADFAFAEVVDAGTEYFFEIGGVEQFRILGIETALGLDPENPAAFVTGLSFVTDGRFTGTMTPITVEVPQVVPLPAGFVLLISAFGGLGLTRVFRRQA